MTNSLDSIPPLIPVPAAPSIARSGNHQSPQKDEEEMLDKFATLFSPPTPRASPTLPPVDDDSIWKTPARLPVQHIEPSTPDSEFGAFVSVSASEDPLAPAQAPSVQPSHTRAISLDFFDQFAKEARERTERDRNVLDELLMHENDPMYWVSGAPGNEEVKDEDEDHWGPPGLSESLRDLDRDFFRPPSQESQPKHPSRHQNASSPFPQSVTRSPTLPTLAPPVASTSSAFPDHENDERERRPSLTGRSSSYQTLSNISSKWMPSFLANNHPNNLASSSTPPPKANTLRHAPTFPFLSASPPTTITHGTPFSGGGSQNHSSPFGPHIYIPPSGAPGFRGESYDWDKGFSKDLDRELEAERSSASSASIVGHGNGRLAPLNASISRSSSLSATPGASRTPSPSMSMSMGGLIEKKTGHVELKGRREMTTPLLETDLADKIRSYLPALSRLHKSWNLLYSLDQHGISLNTLYSRCDIPQKPGTRTGALVVMKDSGDAIFGAYTGDGLHRSGGKGYFGSGESFLWRYDRGELRIYKWTGKNDYVALCEPEYISFGGGDGVYGLYIDSSLLDGSSARCPTFENEVLCSAGNKKGRAVEFECVGLEVWGIGG